ncbi:MAG: hypothetical protein LBK01_03865 [Burkholderiaceae bacterium]|jgi:sugar lactone lactonase YvrE|nr:hypothetical protein [Burkholderiaceae bacterium]
MFSVCCRLLWVILFGAGCFVPVSFAQGTAPAGPARPSAVTRVATFKGVQVTGVTVSSTGRIFACFPRWREGIPFSVVEVMQNGTYRPYPDEQANGWEMGRKLESGRFVAVQSVLAHGKYLYVLDTMNPLWRGVVATPRVYVFDLNSNKLARVYPLYSVTKKNSYVNDLRVDDKNGKIYFTDSGEPGLIVLDTRTGTAVRVLDNHPYTRAEVNHLNFKGKRTPFRVHADGIALDTRRNILYFHALSGYTLYGIPTSALLLGGVTEKEVITVRTPAPDGMTFDAAGRLYMSDLESGKIVYLTFSENGKAQIRTLLEGEDVKWADTFSIHDGWLYYTNSRIDEVGKNGVRDMEFSINRVRLPN